jgi:hypothetical protein
LIEGMNRARQQALLELLHQYRYYKEYWVVLLPVLPVLVPVLAPAKYVLN